MDRVKRAGARGAGRARLSVPCSTHGNKKSTAGKARPEKNQTNPGADRRHEASRGIVKKEWPQRRRQEEQAKLKDYAKKHSTSEAQAAFAREAKEKLRH